jgi:hypothetical protein
MGGIDVKSLFVKEVTTLKKKRKEHFILWGEWGGDTKAAAATGR